MTSISSTITGLPDYDSPEYNEPDYENGSEEANHLAYKKWRKLNALRQFHEDCEYYYEKKPDKSTESIKLKLLYHPGFPKAFVRKVCGNPKNGKPLPLHKIESFLQSTYNTYPRLIERPDCDYLADILRTPVFDIIYSLKRNRAIEWLLTLRPKLPIWPPQFSKPDGEGKRRRLFNAAPQMLTSEQGIAELPEEAQKVEVKSSVFGKEAPSQISETSPFEKVLRAPLDFPTLKTLLLHIGLIGSDGKESRRATAGAWAWAICALQETNLINSTRKAPYITDSLRKFFNANVKKRMIQYGLYDSTSLSKNDDKEFYYNALRYLKDKF